MHNMIRKWKEKTWLLLLIGCVSIPISSCDSNGGASGEGNTEERVYTHAELADEFVLRMGIDLGIHLTLLKATTLLPNYIVVEDLDLYDPVLGKYYSAYFIGDYTVGEDLADYITYNDDIFYYPLVVNEDGTYSGFNGSAEYSTF